MNKAKFRLFLLAAILTGAALTAAAPPPAAAGCAFYCWHVSEDETCCQTRSCDIVCG